VTRVVAQILKATLFPDHTVSAGFKFNVKVRLSSVFANN